MHSKSGIPVGAMRFFIPRFFIPVGAMRFFIPVGAMRFFIPVGAMRFFIPVGAMRFFIPGQISARWRNSTPPPNLTH